MIVRLKETEKADHLFEGWQETIIWSCLQKVMGEIYGDAQEDPTSAMALLGDFCFLAGEPDQELVLYAAGRCRTDFVIMVPQDGRWEAVIEGWRGGLRRGQRSRREAEKSVPVCHKKGAGYL